jgi:crossover junction endodeoxyribonuclease RusA
VMKLDVTLPHPPKALHPNARSHWAAKATATKKARRNGALATLEALDAAHDAGFRKCVFATDGTLSATFYFPAIRKRDDDSLVAWLKAYRDGVADALGIDDNRLRVGAVTAQVTKGRREVVLTVTPDAARPQESSMATEKRKKAKCVKATGPRRVFKLDNEVQTGKIRPGGTVEIVGDGNDAYVWIGDMDGHCLATIGYGSIGTLVRLADAILDITRTPARGARP